MELNDPEPLKALTPFRNVLPFAHFQYTQVTSVPLFHKCRTEKTSARKVYVCIDTTTEQPREKAQSLSGTNANMPAMSDKSRSQVSKRELGISVGRWSGGGEKSAGAYGSDHFEQRR